MWAWIWGQSRDHSALAVVERADLVLDEIDHVTYARPKERRYRVRFLERVREAMRAKPLVGRCTLVMDSLELRRRCWTCCVGHILAAGLRRRF